MGKEQYVPDPEVSEGPEGLKRPWSEVSGGKGSKPYFIFISPALKGFRKLLLRHRCFSLRLMGMGQQVRILGIHTCCWAKCWGERGCGCSCRGALSDSREGRVWVCLNTVPRRFYAPPCRYCLFIRGCGCSSEIVHIRTRPQAHPYHAHVALS